VLLIDSPGLGDSKGEAQDLLNMKQFMSDLKCFGFVTAFLIVVNGTNHRFDQNIQK
jgi:hypothetical protein